MSKRLDVTETLKKRQELINAEAAADRLKVAAVPRPAAFVPNDESVYDIPDATEPLLNVFTFGFMEDGRLGYPADSASFVQDSPRPVTALRPPPFSDKLKAAEAAAKAMAVKKSGSSSRADMKRSSIAFQSKNNSSLVNALKETKEEEEEPEPEKVYYRQFVCFQASAGSRHTLYLAVNIRPSEEANPKARRSKKVLISGLNQQGLCEEAGDPSPREVRLHPDEEPVQVVAGNGLSLVVTRAGNVYAFGNGRYGVLGCGDEETSQVPRQLLSLAGKAVRKVAAGAHHVLALTYSGRVLSWGKNDKGQCGLGVEGGAQLTPTAIEAFTGKEFVFDISCGHEFSVCLAAVVSREGREKTILYAWGDGSRGQLGSADINQRSHPQENRWVTKLLRAYNNTTLGAVSAGGWHVLALTTGNKQVVSWGAGDYGQLGNGFMWDDSQPKVVNEIMDVFAVSAGQRHSVALTDKRGVNDVWVWGYNGYGELGLGDTNVRTQPTRASSFAKATRMLGVAAGARHTVAISTHKAMVVRDDPALRKYFEVAEETAHNHLVLKQVKKLMERQGVDPSLLDRPFESISDQAGASDRVLSIALFDKGLRYCLDTHRDPDEWRRKSYEVCYSVHIDGQHLPSVCLSCAKQCLSHGRLVPYVKLRRPGDHCQCRRSKYCVCRLNKVRAVFDKFTCVDVLDVCVGPCDMRKLLHALRAPAPVSKDELDDCLVSLADGDERASLPRIHPNDFELWYRNYFNEYEEDDDR